MAAELACKNSRSAVLDFSQRQGIHPGIVVGRLQHDGAILPSWFNDLKARFRIVDEV